MQECQSVENIENIVKEIKFGHERNKIELKLKLAAKLKDLMELMKLMSFDKEESRSYDIKLFNFALKNAIDRYGEKYKGNIISFLSLFQDEQINKLAYDIKFNNINDDEKNIFENRLVNLLLIRKNFDKFSSVYISEKSSVIDFKNVKYYSGIIIAKTYRDCFAKYGKEYEETGKITPFMKLFNRYYKKKVLDLKKEKMEENIGLQKEMREDNLNSILTDFEEKIGKKIKTRNYKREDYQKFFKENNATIEEMQKLKDAFSKNYIDYIDQNKDKTDDKPLYLEVDKVARENLEEKNNILKRLIFLLDKANDDLKNNKILYRYFKCYITMKILEERDYDVELVSYIDENFKRYYYNNKNLYLKKDLKLNEDKLFAVYLNKKTDTIRRNYRPKLENFLLKINIS